MLTEVSETTVQGLSPVSLLTPPYFGSDWRVWRHLVTAPPDQFWWAHRNNPWTGFTVNQFGTQVHPGSFLHQGRSDNGFRYLFSPPTTGLYRYRAHYDPVSISIIERGPDVTTLVLARADLWLLRSNGSWERPVGSAVHLLNRHSPPQTLQFDALVREDRAYTLVFFSEVSITHRADQGYGEAILVFPRIEMELLIAGSFAPSIREASPEQGAFLLDKEIPVPDGLQEIL